MRSKGLFAAITTALLALGWAAGAQQGIRIAGTSVTLTPPPGFTARARGFENEAGSSITVSERSADDYAELSATFKSAKDLSAAYAEQKVLIRGVRQLSTPAGPVLFASGTQSTNGREIVKYLALLKGDKTVLVSFNIADRGFSEADAEAVLRSVEIAPAPTLEERLAGMPFTFEAIEPFRVTNVIPRSTVTLGLAGPAEAPGGRQPVIIIGRGESQSAMGEEARVAVDLLKNTGGLREATITAQSPATFAGGAGYVVTAVVEDRTVVQYLRIVPGGAYMRFLARGQTGAMQSAEATITAIAESVEPN